MQDEFDRETFPAVAEPDVVRGEVGKPINIRPLLNDLPGSDPSTPNADLALGGKIPDQGSARIRTDLETASSGSSPTRPAPTSSTTTPPTAMRRSTRQDPHRRPAGPEDALRPGGHARHADRLRPGGRHGRRTRQRRRPGRRPPGRAERRRREAARSTSPSSTAAGCASRPRQGNLSPNPQLVRYSVSNGSQIALAARSSSTNDRPRGQHAGHGDRPRHRPRRLGRRGAGPRQRLSARRVTGSPSPTRRPSSCRESSGSTPRSTSRVTSAGRSSPVAWSATSHPRTSRNGQLRGQLRRREPARARRHRAG